MNKKNLFVITGIALITLVCALLIALALDLPIKPATPQIKPEEQVGAVKKTKLNTGNCGKNIDCALDLNGKGNLKITGRNKEWKDALLGGKKLKVKNTEAKEILGAEIFEYGMMEAASELDNFWLAELKICQIISGSNCRPYMIAPSRDLTIPDVSEFIKSLQTIDTYIESYL